MGAEKIGISKIEVFDTDGYVRDRASYTLNTSQTSSNVFASFNGPINAQDSQQSVVHDFPLQLDFINPRLKIEVDSLDDYSWVEFDFCEDVQLGCIEFFLESEAGSESLDQIENLIIQLDGIIIFAVSYLPQFLTIQGNLQDSMDGLNQNIKAVLFSEASRILKRVPLRPNTKPQQPSSNLAQIKFLDQDSNPMSQFMSNITPKKKKLDISVNGSAVFGLIDAKNSQPN